MFCSRQRCLDPQCRLRRSTSSHRCWRWWCQVSEEKGCSSVGWGHNNRGGWYRACPASRLFLRTVGREEEEERSESDGGRAEVYASEVIVNNNNTNTNTV